MTRIEFTSLLEINGKNNSRCAAMAKKRSVQGIDLLFNKRFMQAAALLLLFYFVILPYWEIIVAICFYAIFIYALLRSKSHETKRNEVLEKDIEEIDAMNGLDFEQYLGALFEEMGYMVKFTPASGDYGADLLLTKGNRTIAVQAKRYSSTVGVKAVQEASGAKGFYKTNEAWVVTNNSFTKNACNFAEKIQVRLIDRDQLINFIVRHKNKKLEKVMSPKAITPTVGENDKA